MKVSYWFVSALIIVVVILVAIALNGASQPHVVTAVPSYPSMRLVGNQCVGTYSNGVGVSWPAVNGTC